MKYDIHTLAPGHKLSPIEAKTDITPLTNAYSSGAFPTLSSAQAQQAAGQELPSNTIGDIRPHAARSSGPVQYAPSSFAQELGQGDASHLGQPASAESRMLFNPWSAQQAQSAQDPWQAYLLKRDAREQQDREDASNEKGTRRAVGGLASAVGIGMLLAKLSGGKGIGLSLSDAASKKRKLPIGRRAQDPIPDMPAVSERGVIMSDEKSKAEITRLTQENHNLSNALDAMAPHKQGADTFPRDYSAPAPAAPGDATAQLPRIDLAALNAQRNARALQNRKAAVTPGMAPAPTEPARAPTAKKQAGKQAPDRTTLEQDVWSAKKAAADAEEGARLGVPNPDFIYAPSHMMERQYNYDNAGGTGAYLTGEQPTGQGPTAYGPRATLEAGGGIDPLTVPVPYHPSNIDQYFGEGDSGQNVWGPTDYESRRYFQNPVDPAMNQTMSDERSKTAIDAIRAAPGYSYKYKQPNAPGAAPGTHYGPMAQDLEKTPMGASTVVQSPDGVKMVDTGRLALVNTAALHAQQDELDQLKQELAALRGKRAG